MVSTREICLGRGAPEGLRKASGLVQTPSYAPDVPWHCQSVLRLARHVHPRAERPVTATYLRMRARASARRCFWPPDSSLSVTGVS